MAALSAAAGPPAQKRYQTELLPNHTHPSGKQRLGRGGQNLEGDTEIYDFQPPSRGLAATLTSSHLFPSPVQSEAKGKQVKRNENMSFL